jgi:hypothetical protein
MQDKDNKVLELLKTQEQLALYEAEKKFLQETEDFAKRGKLFVIVQVFIVGMFMVGLLAFVGKDYIKLNSITTSFISLGLYYLVIREITETIKVYKNYQDVKRKIEQVAKEHKQRDIEVEQQKNDKIVN